jgi:predicted transcriptional regulator
MTEVVSSVKESLEKSELEVVSEKGLSSSQAKIYLTLTKKGPLAFESLSETLDLDKTEVYRAILRLQKLGFVYIGAVPARVYALKMPFLAR